MKRILTIADIHGGLKALIQVLERSQYNPKQDKLIFLGDFCDGWGQTSELIEYLIELKKENSDIIFLKGNHDEWTREWIIFGIGANIWKTQGGLATIESYTNTGYVNKESHREFFNKLENYYIDDQNRAFVHGGFTSHRGLGHEPYQSNYYWDRTLWEGALASKGSWDNNPDLIPYMMKRLSKHKEIYIGHTSTTMWNYKNGFIEGGTIGTKVTTPINACNVWNLDTGAGWGGKLTIMDIDTKEFWQSDFVSDLYPEEKGRN
jgi:serine/threonine protein phosphatase 1